MKIKFLLFTFYSLFFIVFTTLSQRKSDKIIDSLLSVVKKQNNKEKVMTYIELAEKYTGIDLDSAQFYTDKAFKIASKENDKRLLIIATLQQGNFAREKSEYYTALDYFKNTLQLSKELNDSILIANSFNGIGIVNSRLGNFKNAITNFYKALELYEQKRDTINISRCYLNLAIDFRKVKEFDKSIHYNLKAIKLFEKTNEHLNIAAIYNNLGGVYNENQEYEKAIKSAEKAKEYFEKNGYERYTAYPLTNISISYDSLNQPKKAEETYKKAIEIHTKYREPYELAFLNNAYANLKYKQKKYNEAIQIGQNALDFAKEVDALEFITSATKTLAKSYQKNNDFKKANDFLNQHLIAKDSLITRAKNKDIADIQTKYETSQKETEIAQQKEKLLAQELAIKNRTVYAILFASLLAILGIVFFAIYKRNQLKQRQLQKEIDLKDALATIKTQNRLQEQRLRISRDLHDNIGSQLTFIISSLDNLKMISKQADEKLKDKIGNISSFTSQTIHELRDTIWAMNKNEISLEDLQARILSFIQKAKNAVPNINFSIQNNADVKEVFSSIAGINIFRVIQEAINNAIKYADASKIEIILNKKENDFIVEIIDNGKGFNIKEVQLGNGLSNMEKRINEINGKVFFNSIPNKGTKIVLKCNL